MAVYVDDMRAKFGRMIMCHMVADTFGELHAMADKIGVARKWFQGDHYDIALSKRAIAVEAGALEIRQIECLGITRPQTKERIEAVMAKRTPPQIPIWKRTQTNE